MKATLAVSATLLLSSSVSIWAQDSRRSSSRMPILVRALDLDRDGVISLSEMEKAPASLKELDKNGDGKLATSEITSGESRRRGDGRNSRRRGGGGPRPNDFGEVGRGLGESGITWYGRLDTALAEAKRSNRPILFMAAASQCNGVPGVF